MFHLHELLLPGVASSVSCRVVSCRVLFCKLIMIISHFIKRYGSIRVRSKADVKSELTGKTVGIKVFRLNIDLKQVHIC